MIVEDRIVVPLMLGITEKIMKYHVAQCHHKVFIFDYIEVATIFLLFKYILPISLI